MQYFLGFAFGATLTAIFTNPMKYGDTSPMWVLIFIYMVCAMIFEHNNKGN